YAGINFRRTNSEIRNPDGSVVFRLDNVEVPDSWSQVASDVLAQKYFRKAGIPARLKKVEENSVPSFLWRSAEDADALQALPESERLVGEWSARQVFDRLAGTWTYWGWKGGYFDSEEDARAFFDELRFMLAMQMCAPNSPQWFNTGLHWAYGIDGPSQGNRSEEHTSELQSPCNLVCRLLLEKKKAPETRSRRCRTPSGVCGSCFWFPIPSSFLYASCCCYTFCSDLVLALLPFFFGC